MLLAATKWLLLLRRHVHSQGRKKEIIPLSAWRVCLWNLVDGFHLCVMGRKVWEGEGQGGTSPSKQGSLHQVGKPGFPGAGAPDHELSEGRGASSFPCSLLRAGLLLHRWLANT